ncbi:hypothetical protein ACN1TK_003867, partial [Vibrio cholerae]
ATMSCNNCVSIGKKHLGGFKSPSKYALSQKACDALVISNIWVEEPSSNQFDRRFKCKCCGDQWCLEWPDPPISGGLWQKTSRQQKIAELSQKLRNRPSATVFKKW